MTADPATAAKGQRALPLYTEAATENSERLADALMVLRMVDDNNRVCAGEPRKAWDGKFVAREVRRVLRGA